MCKQSAPRSRQITMPAPFHSIFTGFMLFLTPNQQCQSTQGNSVCHIKLVACVSEPCRMHCMVYLQVASRALDVPVDFIHISDTASNLVANAVLTAASCSSQLFGGAVLVSRVLSLYHRHHHFFNKHSWQNATITSSEQLINVFKK